MTDTPMRGARANTWLAIWHGFSGRCPKCGEGKLFRAYLKPVDDCSKCGESLGSIRADDGPAWLTVLVIGHIVGGLALFVETHFRLSLAVSISLFVCITLVAALSFLPRAKGIFVGAIWAMKPPGSGANDD